MRMLDPSHQVPHAERFLCFSGLAVVFAEDVPGVSEEDIVTGEYQRSRARVRTKRLVLDEWRELCPIYNNFINSTTGNTLFVHSLPPLVFILWVLMTDIICGFHTQGQ
jgi:hypothetical protein